MAVYPVEVECAGGAVTLRGRVRSWYARQLAGWLAEGVPGTSLVDNRISVDTTSARGDQAACCRRNQSAAMTPFLDSTHVQVAARAVIDPGGNGC